MLRSLKNFLLECDVIVHLAGKNRGPDKEVYDCNLHFASQLIKMLEKSHATPYVLFASQAGESGKTNMDAQRKKQRICLLIGQIETTQSSLLLSYPIYSGHSVNQIITPWSQLSAIS